MDGMTAFERQVADELTAMAGPPPSIDAMHIVHTARAAAQPRRFHSMFSVTRFAVAGVILALFGAVAYSSVPRTPRGEAPASAVDATASPSPSLPPAGAAIDPCTTPVLPVAGTINWGYEKSGTQRYFTDSGTHVRGFVYVSTMALDDDRLNGSTTATADFWDYSSEAGISRGTRIIENEDGTWEGPEISVSRSETSFIAMMDLVGTGAYEGLSATLFLTNHGDVVIEGSIYPTDLASCDFAAMQ